MLNIRMLNNNSQYHFYANFIYYYIFLEETIFESVQLISLLPTYLIQLLCIIISYTIGKNTNKIEGFELIFSLCTKVPQYYILEVIVLI